MIVNWRVCRQRQGPLRSLMLSKARKSADAKAPDAPIGHGGCHEPAAQDCQVISPPILSNKNRQRPPSSDAVILQHCTRRHLNRWNIPPSLEQLVHARDLNCIYCRRQFGDALAARGSRKSWEHIVNDETIITPENIALCCISCNASKGTKLLRDWLSSRYCHSRGITPTRIE